MSSGASTAYEKPRSGRSSCIDETPRSSRTTSARTPFSASCSSTVENSPWSRRALTPWLRRKRSKYGATRRIAVDRDQLAVAAQAAASSEAWPPAPKVPSTTVSPGRGSRSGDDLVREDGDVVGLSWQDARQHLPRSLRPRAAVGAIRRGPRSPGGRRRRPRSPRGRAPRARAARPGSTMRPCRSSSPCAAPAKKCRCMHARALGERVEAAQSGRPVSPTRRAGRRRGSRRARA